MVFLIPILIIFLYVEKHDLLYYVVSYSCNRNSKNKKFRIKFRWKCLFTLQLGIRQKKDGVKLLTFLMYNY